MKRLFAERRGHMTPKVVLDEGMPKPPTPYPLTFNKDTKLVPSLQRTVSESIVIDAESDSCRMFREKVQGTQRGGRETLRFVSRNYFVCCVIDHNDEIAAQPCIRIHT